MRWARRLYHDDCLSNWRPLIRVTVLWVPRSLLFSFGLVAVGSI